MSSEKLQLEIDGHTISCDKNVLIENSDYFKAMLKGNFIESTKSNIKLQGVNLKAMELILSLLWDNTMLIDNEYILPILQTACMLQFVAIKDLCISKLTEMLNPENCIRIWKVTEQLDLKPLWMKAKCMALEDFLQIRNSEAVLELSLGEVCAYLGEVSLNVQNEFIIFQTVMNWWYENVDDYKTETTENLLRLLSCIHFPTVEEDYLNEMLTYPDLSENVYILDVLKCILAFKKGSPTPLDIPEACQMSAKLLNSSRKREIDYFPCILLETVFSEQKLKRPKQIRDQKDVVFYDKFKRKRLYKIVEENSQNTFSTAFYDTNLRKYFHMLPIDEDKCRSLDGFKLVGYKEFIFMYGGEFLLGKGDWNFNFWVYDTFRERWERKCLLPYPRRHFETCIIDSNVFIIGGTGSFRVIQENMFWYNFKEDKWSKKIMLPCPGRQLKCCNFNSKLFVLNISDKCGYFFDENTFIWTKIDVLMEESVISDLSEFTIFAWRDKFYIKGKKLIELEIKNKKLSMVTSKEIHNFVCDKIEAALCNNLVYTLYKCRTDDNDTYTFEIYDLETENLSYVFKSVPTDYVIVVDNNNYRVSPILKLFPFRHYSLAEKKLLINNKFK